METIIRLENEQYVVKDEKLVLIKGGEKKYVVGRFYYYLLKTLYSIPRLYGIKSTEPISDWKKEFERQFTNIIRNEIDLAKISFNVDFRMDLNKLELSGKVSKNDISLHLEIKETPKLSEDDRGIRGLMKVDSFYFSNLDRKKPFIILATRAGLISAFYKFLPYQFEGASGIPKTFGLLSDFINAINIPLGYREEILGHQVYVRDNDIFCDSEIIYNAPPEILSLFPIMFLLKTSNERNVIIIEDPEVHLSEEGKLFLKNLILSAKANVVLVSDSFY
ncbi:hypothetical protein BFU36_09570 [Sulfolobus sp. A20]|uniref:hypothetical protein n=1 Tax=Saccharolobus sp. A20 TaxID=1891280 RepID=UPI00084618F5|nr:hypothetical protein [Sulfolobus sp. A20]TRM75249.1 hypothetical protein DJ528_09555 [Sulfolobus sp. B5]TRM78691.1 hypothetical protein DJ532_00020 [Sulfolobus sp. A20-N-F8]TRM84490.1 hypothetical protein DJ522_04555 [Sulfolobus sp. F3]TRM86754.1 hypothetical protein DJ529_10435 [Sulfolobus sp. C3]TRM92471.1 hypothetical protein DJ526_05960 [Sulfolobus sp. A20-N-G8]TRN02616.1 hypothetical protein DJ527_03485 [Sulfolobus sp. F1]